MEVFACACEVLLRRSICRLSWRFGVDGDCVRFHDEDVVVVVCEILIVATPSPGRPCRRPRRNQPFSDLGRRYSDRGCARKLKKLAMCRPLLAHRGGLLGTAEG